MSIPSFRIDPGRDWGPSDFDVRHSWRGLTYAIPSVGSSTAWRAITSEWSADAIITARSALPVNVVTGTTVFSVSNALRPDLVANVPLYVDDATVPGGRRFNRAAFAAPPLDASGNPLRQGSLPTQCAARVCDEPGRPRGAPRHSRSRRGDARNCASRCSTCSTRSVSARRPTR